MEAMRVTASEFQQAFGMLSGKARQQPVVITKHGRDSLVVVPVEEWERLKRRDRRVGLTADLPPEWLEAVRSAKVSEEFAHLDAEVLISKHDHDEYVRLKSLATRAFRVEDISDEAIAALEKAEMNPVHNHLDALMDD
jgi:prevent-host-death family protein